jgi:hypothetical protein
VIRKPVRIEAGSLVRFRDSSMPLSAPVRVIEMTENGEIAKLEDGIWWPVFVLISEADWQEDDA